MKDYQTSGLYVDENVVRIIAAQVVVITIFILLTHWYIPAFLLAIDFALRAFSTIPSPLALIAKSISGALKIAPQPIFAPPKRFAALLGFVFSIGISTLFFIESPISAYILGSILIFCAILESGFKVCLGCYVYNWLVLPVRNKIKPQ
jgi:hypothetical protein